MPDASKQCRFALATCWVLFAFALGASGGLAAEPVEILYEQADREAPGVVATSWLALGLLTLLIVSLGGMYRYFRSRLRQVRDQLEQAESRLREAQLIACIGSWSRDFDSGETFWSEEACNLLGLQGREQEYRHYETLIHPDDVERVTEVVAAAYHQGGSYLCDHRVVCPGNVEKYVRLAGRVYLGDGQSPVRETGTVQDITQQHLAATVVQRNEKRLRAILDATPYPILILENVELFPVLYANRSAYALFALDQNLAAEDIRATSFWIDSLALSRLAATIGEQVQVQAVEALLKNKAGTSFWAELSGSSMDYSGVDALLLTVLDMTERRRLQSELERVSHIDALTGAHNRSSFLQLMQQELRRSLRHRHLYSLLLMDIDHFNRVNQTYGHVVGDDIIRRFCEVARSCLREEDLFGRVGGEEFGALLVSSQDGGGYLVAERIRKRWQDEAFEIGVARCNFTVSIGVAQLQSDQDTTEAIMERASLGLRSAKLAGRNSVIVYSGDHGHNVKRFKPAQ